MPSWAAPLFTSLTLLITFRGLSAQDTSAVARAHDRRGFWLGAAAGYGSSAVSCSGCASIPTRGGETLLLELGGTLNPRVLLGVEANAWTKTEAGSTDYLAALSFTVYEYPMPRHPLFFKIGAGYSKFHESSSTFGSSGGSGFGGVAGAGYDLRIARNVFLTPAVNFTYGRVGDVTVGSLGVVSGWTQHVIDFVIGVRAQFPPEHHGGRE